MKDEDPDELLPFFVGGRSRSEIEIIAGVLRANDIPFVFSGQYDYKGPKQLLVPRGRFHDAEAVLDRARATDPQPKFPGPSSLPRITIAGWAIIGAMLLYILLQRLFR